MNKVISLINQWYYISLLIFFSSCVCLNSTKDNWKLDKYIYPLDTINLEGYIHVLKHGNNSITLFSKEEKVSKRNFEQQLLQGKIVIYIESYLFNFSTPFPNKNVNYFSSSQSDSLITKLIIKDSETCKRKVSGKFILGVTNTNRFNNIISHNYRFKNNYKVLIICPMIN